MVYYGRKPGWQLAPSFVNKYDNNQTAKVNESHCIFKVAMVSLLKQYFFLTCISSKTKNIGSESLAYSPLKRDDFMTYL